MSFLLPGALFGLALLAVPVVVHLFRPRHVRQTPFSSLRWLHLTQQRMARRIQWHQVLLFLLRAGFLTLLVLALARPIWSPRGTAAGRDRILVLDVSRSMGRQVAGRRTPWEIARDLASQLLRGMLPGDRSAVLLTGNTTEVLAPWTSHSIMYLPALTQRQSGSTETRLDSALEPIRRLLALRRAGVPVEVIFLTDNPTNGWNTSDISTFSQDVAGQTDVSFRLIDVSLPAPRNGWLSAARLRIRNSESVLRVEAACVGDEVMQRTLRVSGLSGLVPQDIPLTLSPGKRTTLDLPLPATFDRAASQVTLKLEPADELPDDDLYYCDLDSLGASQLLLIAPESRDAALRPGLALEAAIRSLAETGSMAADGQLAVQTPATLSADDIVSADVILLADVAGLSEALSAAVSQRVRHGAGLIMFLGPSVDADSYNRAFVHPLQAQHSVLPSELAGSVQADARRGGLAPWKQWNDRHPLLAGLLDPEVGDLAATQSRAWHRFREPPQSADEVLATLDDGTPALIARRVEAGRVLIVNGSADDRWCDLPRRRSFVPFVDRLLSHVQSAGIRRQFTAGEVINLSLPESFDASLSPGVISPTGRTLPTTMRTVANRTWLTLSDTTESGFYYISSPNSEASRGRIVFTVQPGRADSRLESFDADNFRAWWAPAEIKIEQPTATASPVVANDRRVVLEPWLTGLACLCLIAEFLLTHWLCPRMNPAVSTSHHRRRGFVAPLREREGSAS